MDEVARMLADLGDAHRNEVSDPNGKHLLRAAGQYEQKDEHRRKLAHDQAKANAGNKQHAALSAWNTKENFSGDSMIEGLANHFSGQGHRDTLQSMNLQRRSQFGQSQGQAHNGGMGGNWARGNGGQGNHVAATPSVTGTRGGRQAGLSLPTGLPDTAPIKAKAPVKTGARATITSATQPLPTVRHQAQPRPAHVAATAAQPGTPIRVARTAATSGQSSSVPIRGPQDVVRTSATADSPRQSTLNATSSTSSARSSATGTSTIVRVLHNAPPPPRAAVPIDHYRDIASVKMGEYYAANPGPQCDKYYQMFPERLPYLTKALEELAKKKQKKPAEIEKQVTSAVPSATGNSGGERQAEKTASGDVHEVKKAVKEKIVDEAVKEAEVPVKKVVKENVVKEKVKKDEAPAKKTATKPIKKEVVEEATIQKHTTPAVVKKETLEKATEVEIPQVSAEQHSHEPDLKESASSVDSSSGSVVTASAESTGFAVAPPTTKPPMYGKLVVTYLNAQSGHLRTDIIDINAPIQASLQFTSTADGYDPRAVAEAVQTLAKSLCLQDKTIRLERRDDGLWQEVFDDDL